MGSIHQNINEHSLSQKVDSDPIFESHERMSAFFQEIQKAALNSEEHYDQKVFALSAGSIGIELAVLQFLHSCLQGIALAVLSVGCFVLALFLNLIVHYVAKCQQDKQSEMVRSFLGSNKTDDSYIYDRILKDNKILEVINLISIVALVVGVICLAVFAFVNLTPKAS